MALLRRSENAMIDSTSDDAISTPDRDNASDPTDATYRVRSRESVSEAVIRAVRSETQLGIVELPPLYSTVEPDALDRLFTHPGLGAEASGRADAVIEFSYADTLVHVKSDGTITVVPPDRR